MMVSVTSETMQELFPDLAELQNNISRRCSQSGSETSEKSSLLAEELCFEDELDLVNYLSGNAMGAGSENKDGGLTDAVALPSSGTRRSGETRPTRQAELDHGPCMSKNAIAARENRLKKKNYIGTLEKTVRELRNENLAMKTKMAGLEKNVTSLKEEVKYLRAVLANQSTLSALLRNIPKTAGVQLQSSELNNNDLTKISRKRKYITIAQPKVKQSCDVDQDNNDMSDSNDDLDCVSIKKVPKTDHSYATSVGSQDFDWDESSDVEIEVELEDLEVESTPTSPSAGVCLHVAGNRVSLEFCADCSQKASGESSQDHWHWGGPWTVINLTCLGKRTEKILKTPKIYFCTL